jgi:hypothetical protein
LGAFSSSSKTSNFPPVLALTPRNLAGITRELFSTSTSPGISNSRKAGNRRCSMRFSPRCKTRRRDASRLGAGCCAINSGGSSKSKSAVRIGASFELKPSSFKLLCDERLFAAISGL